MNCQALFSGKESFNFCMLNLPFACKELKSLFCVSPKTLRRLVVCLYVCHFVLVFFGPFSIAITSLGGRVGVGGWRGGGGGLLMVLFVRLFGLCLFGFVGFFFLLGSGRGCGL